MRKTRILLPVLLALNLTACGLAGNMADLLQKQQDVKAELLKEYGLKSEIGFNYTNGRLTVVSVTVEWPEVRGMQIDALISQVEPVIARHFEQTPETLLVSVSKSP